MIRVYSVNIYIIFYTTTQDYRGKNWKVKIINNLNLLFQIFVIDKGTVVQGRLNSLVTSTYLLNPQENRWGFAFSYSKCL